MAVLSPLAPTHVTEYDVPVVRAAVVKDPDVVFALVVPALQELVFAEAHFITDVPPETTDGGVAVSVTDGRVLEILEILI